MLRKIAMNILKNDTSGPKKISKNMKRFRASMDDGLLEEIINNI